MNTVISVKVDKKTKEAAQEVAKSMGLTLSTLINTYLIQVVHSRRVELFAPVKMTPHLEKLLEPIEADIKAGRNLSPAFTSGEDAIAWLHSMRK
jgi:addiction module RelB/DinJ family antitoxin